VKLRDLAERLGVELEGDGDAEIIGCAPIEEAGPTELSFVGNPRYASKLARSAAGAVIVTAATDAGRRNVLRSEEPQITFARALALFDNRPQPRPGIHPTAVVSPSARIGQRAYLGPYTVVGDDVTIGDDAVLHPHVTIYPQATIGHRFTAHSGAVVRECVKISDDVTLQPGAVVGSDGFGFLPRGKSLPLAIRQTGTVEIASHVDVGANTTVDRAATGSTRLGQGVKVDNLVQIAHGCEVGERTIIAAQTGLAGSATIGQGVLLGGQVGITGHVTVGDAVQVAAQSGVAGDVAEGSVVGGSPAIEFALWRRAVVALRRLPEILKRLRALEERLGGEREDA
jgi:UDP-3-O-[3-hydroxymyristoyl] glucosamine N-acyltransferase